MNKFYKASSVTLSIFLIASCGGGGGGGSAEAGAVSYTHLRAHET